MILQILGYAPDADPTTPGILTGCAGAVPSLKGMRGAPSPASTPQTSLGATCQGAASVTKLDLSTRLFAGTPTKIYEASVSTWGDVSRSAVYTTAATNRWRFAQQSNVSFAANGADTLQASVSTGPFSDIGNAPVAGIVEVVGAFVFALNTSSSTAGVRWAGINGYTSWAASINTQAGETTLTSSPGPILAARRFGAGLIVYKKTSMYIGTYSGPPNIWDFNLIPGNAGALSQEVVVNVGTPENPKHIFMGEDNFYVFDGARPVPIGNNRVSQTVFSNMLQSRYYACMALHDRKNFLVYFYYPVSDSVFPDKCVVYNYRTDKWGVDDRQVQATVDYFSPGVTYDSLGGSYVTYESLPSIQYDLAFQNSSRAQPAIFDMNNNMKTLTGATTASSITTGDFGDDVRVTTVNRVRPRFVSSAQLGSSATVSWTPYYRMVSGDTLSADNAVGLSNGAFDFVREARWHRGKMDLNCDWELNAISVEGTEGSLE